MFSCYPIYLEKKIWGHRGFKIISNRLCFVLAIVTELNVSEFNQMYEIRGRPLSDPIACEAHGASQERQNSRAVCVGLLILSLKTVSSMSVYRLDSLF